MKQISLLRNFMVWVVLAPISLAIAFALVVFLIAPSVAWLFTKQWMLAPFNKMVGSVLLSIPIGIMFAGSNTLLLWYGRTDMPRIRKVAILAIVTLIIGFAPLPMVLWINILFPH